MLHTDRFTNNEAPLVTIGITCYNAATTIKNAILSAINQEWPNKEIIIVDDCSTDESVEIVRSIIDRNENIRLICSSSNKGAASSRNTIIENATGHFVAFFDDDDESMPLRVRQQVERLTRFNEVYPDCTAICYSGRLRRYANGYEKILPAIGQNTGSEPHGNEIIDFLLLYEKRPGREYGSGTPTCSMMGPRIFFKDIGMFDCEFKRVEDLEFAIRAGLEGAAFIGTKEVGVVQYATDSSDKKPEINRDSEIMLAEKYSSYLIGKNKYYYARKWPLLRYYHFKKNYISFIYTFLGIFIRHPIKSVQHLLDVAPRRLMHEAKIHKDAE